MNEFTVSCVRIATQHLFTENLILEQHKLRYRVLVEQLNWAGVFVESDMEFDRYDNPATEYFVAANRSGEVVGCIRTHPTTIPYMLSEVFPYLIAGKAPIFDEVQELSRLVCDGTLLSRQQKATVTQLLFLAVVKRGLQRNIRSYVGFVDATVGQEVFVRDKWQMHHCSDLFKLDSGEYVHGVVLPISTVIMREMEKALIDKSEGGTRLSLSFGQGSSRDFLANATYSPATISQKSGLYHRVRFKLRVVLMSLKNKVRQVQGQYSALKDR